MEELTDDQKNCLKRVRNKRVIHQGGKDELGGLWRGVYDLGMIRFKGKKPSEGQRILLTQKGKDYLKRF